MNAPRVRQRHPRVSQKRRAASPRFASAMAQSSRTGSLGDAAAARTLVREKGGTVTDHLNAIVVARMGQPPLAPIAALAVVLLACRPAAVASSPPPAPIVAADASGERDRMVRDQVEARGVRDPLTLAAMRKVPRHELVPADVRP